MFGYGHQSAFACQCSRLAPDKYYEMSDVIFLGRVASVDGNQPLDQATHVTFNVSKSWKGVDTKVVTIRTGDGTSCGFYRFGQDHEYLVYGTKTLSTIDVNQCGGTASIDSDADFVNRDLQFLSGYTPLELKAGHTMSINPIPILTVVGSLVAISLTTFVILKKWA
jgi:hypothetical protein